MVIAFCICPLIFDPLLETFASFQPPHRSLSPLLPFHMLGSPPEIITNLPWIDIFVIILSIIFSYIIILCSSLYIYIFSTVFVLIRFFLNHGTFHIFLFSLFVCPARALHISSSSHFVGSTACFVRPHLLLHKHVLSFPGEIFHCPTLPECWR